jgi:signal transduction histidine kinase
VAEVVANAALALQPAAAEAGLRLIVTVPDGPVLARSDPERLAQVVANLVENALKYATSEVEVEVRPGPGAGGAAEIAVSDDGPGIHPDDRARVFERLYTSRRQPGRKVGTGLGLAIVRQLVTAMGGTVEVSADSEGDRPPGGTRFVVSLSGAEWSWSAAGWSSSPAT